MQLIIGIPFTSTQLTPNTGQVQTNIKANNFNQIIQAQADLINAIKNNDSDSIRQIQQRLNKLGANKVRLPRNTVTQYRNQIENITNQISTTMNEINTAQTKNDPQALAEAMARQSTLETLRYAYISFITNNPDK